MYSVDPKVKRVHREVLRFRRRLLADRQDSFEGFDFHSGIKGLANSSARALLRGRAERVYPLSLKVASSVLGAEVIGCGEESLVVLSGLPPTSPRAVIKYATRPAWDVHEIRDELSRRFDVAQKYIGKWVAETEFEIGGVKRDGELVPELVVMTQAHIPIATEDYSAHPELGEFCERAVAMGYDEGLTFDLTVGAGNLVIDTDGRLIHLDTPYTSREQDGKVGLLSPNILDSRVNIAKLEEVLASVS